MPQPPGQLPAFVIFTTTSRISHKARSVTNGASSAGAVTGCDSNGLLSTETMNSRIASSEIAFRAAGPVSSGRVPGGAC